MAKNIGIDLGFGFVKVTDGQKDLTFPSVVGTGQDLAYRSELSTYLDPIDNLAITIDDKSYFVGELAVRQSEFPSRSLSENFAREKNTKVLLLAALALFAPGDVQEFNVVTGLAPSYYLAFKDELGRMIQGRHTIRLNVDGTDKEKTLNVGQVKVIPQPLGTLFQKLLDAEGALADKELARSKIGIIDVGFRTTDFAVVDRLEYIDKMSCSSITGMSKAYAIVAEYLRNAFRVYKENFELDEIVSQAKIKIAGKVHAFDDVKKDAFDQVASKIVTEMNSLWDCRELDTILISGGGGKAISEQLLPALENAVLADDAQIANVRGYYKLAKKTFG